MLNVLQLIPTLDRSGAEKQMVLLAKGLPRDRFEVEVAAARRHDRPPPHARIHLFSPPPRSAWVQRPTPGFIPSLLLLVEPA